jgi:hypothetical protein
MSNKSKKPQPLASSGLATPCARPLASSGLAHGVAYSFGYYLTCILIAATLVHIAITYMVYENPEDMDPYVAFTYTLVAAVYWVGYNFYNLFTYGDLQKQKAEIINIVTAAGSSNAVSIADGLLSRQNKSRYQYVVYIMENLYMLWVLVILIGYTTYNHTFMHVFSVPVLCLVFAGMLCSHMLSSLLTDMRLRMLDKQGSAKDTSV